MKEKILLIAVSVCLGLILPGVVIRMFKPEEKPNLTGSGATSANITMTPTTPSINETEGQQKQSGLWVLHEEHTQWMDMETYIIGVILAEMPTTYDHDALCAQAVAARTYALKRQSSDKHPNGAVCTNAQCCQAYWSIPEFLDGHGYQADVISAQKAALDTAGMVLTYADKLIEATYYHSSGGKTEQALAVWGVDLPYLQSVESPGEEDLEGFSNRIFYTESDLEQLLDRSLTGVPAGWIGLFTYTPGGGVETMYFAGVQYTGIQLRSLLKLSSTAFSIEPAEDGLWFTALGKGHRVGMSQTGAQAMALCGASWQEILAHYYPGTRIDKMEDVG